MSWLPIEGLSTAKLDLALTVDIEDFHHNFLAFVKNVGDFPNATMVKLGDVAKAFTTGAYFDESAEVHDLLNGTEVDATDFGVRRYGTDVLLGSFGRVDVLRDNIDHTVIVDVDLDPCVSNDLLDALSTRSDEILDLILLDLEAENTRSRFSRGNRDIECFVFCAVVHSPAAEKG